jgi:hypothetical protein
MSGKPLFLNNIILYIMFGYFSDEVVEENVVMGLTNELLTIEYPEAVSACRQKAWEISRSLTVQERRFIAEWKARSIIIPFSSSRSGDKCLPSGDMITLVELVEVLKLMKEHGLKNCIGCNTLDFELQRGESGDLIVKETTLDPQECFTCSNNKLASGRKSREWLPRSKALDLPAD